MSWKLMKVEEGVDEGEVLYNGCQWDVFPYF